MKRIIRLIAMIACLVLLGSIKVHAQLIEELTNTQDILRQNPPLLSNYSFGSHPFLLLNSSKIATINAKVGQDPWKTWYASIQGAAAKNSTVLINDKGNGLKSAAMIAMYYQLTGTSTYATTVKAKLDSIESISAEAGSAKGGHRAEQFIPYLVCYDLIYNTASSAQKTKYQAVIAQEAQSWDAALRAIIPNITNVNFNNHEFKAAAALVYAALAYPEHSAAQSWLNTGMQVIRYAYYGRPNCLNAEGYQVRAYSPDGVFTEGSWYDKYTMDSFLPMMLSYQKLLGVNLFNDNMIYKSFEAILRMRMPDGLLTSFSDSNRPTFPTFHCAKHFGLLQNYIAYGENSGNWDYFSAPFYLAFYDAKITPKAADSLFPSPSQFFENSGDVVFRSDWTSEGSYLHMIGKHSPGISSHSQSDHGSFTIYAHGTYLAIDPGYGDWTYNHTTNPWMISSMAHNMVTVDGKGPNGVLKYFDPAILQQEHWSSSIMDVATIKTPYRHAHTFKNADGTWASEWSNNVFSDPVTVTRTALFLKGMVTASDNEYFIVIDQMDGSASHVYDLNLHAKGTLAVDGTKQTLAWLTPRETGGTGNVELRVGVNATGPLALSQKTGPNYETVNGGCLFCADQHSYVEARLQATDGAFISLLYPRTATMTAPTFAKVSGTLGAAGVSLTLTQGTDSVYDLAYAKVVPGTTSVGKLSSDADIGLVRTKNNVLRSYFLRKGKSLTYDNIRLVNSSIPLLAASIEYTGDGISGTVFCESAGTVEFCSRTGDKCISKSYSKGKATIQETFTSLSGPEEYHWLETENSTHMTSPMQVESDSAASGGKFVYAPNGAGSNMDQDNTTEATYALTIQTAGEYVLWGRVITADAGADSFYVQIDSGTVNLWEPDVVTSWQWEEVSNRDGMDPVVVKLSAGTHVVKIRLREDGAKIDKLLITNNKTYTPSLGGEPAENMSPTPVTASPPVVTTTPPPTAPPSIPIVTDSGPYSSSPTQLTASWTAVSDSPSGVSEYQYQITSDTPTGTVVKSWTSTGRSLSVTATGLTLTNGKKYYFGVKAKNGAGVWSSVGYSDGITVSVTVDKVVDNTDAGFTKTGTWTTSSAVSAYPLDAGDSVYSNVVNSTATWTATLPLGTYQVYAWWTTTDNRATAAVYKIYNGATQVGTATVNQTTAGGGGGKWNSLGSCTITAATGKVTLTVTDGTKFYSADAIRFVK